MEIVNVRVDERLIHGQVAAYWTNNLNASRIMVIDDMAAKNDIQKMALKMACPSSVKLSILGVDRAVERLKEGAYEGEKVFIVLKGPGTLRRILELGYKFERVNIGNMANKGGTVAIKRTVHVTKSEADDFKWISAQGVYLYAQMVPADDAVDFISLIEAAKFD